MRIIAGRFRRRPLQAPKGKSTRPSTDRTREALFNMVENRMELAGADVLDLFAGSGALGLEALSRGAQFTMFVESDGRALGYARRNAASLGVEANCRFVRADAVPFMTRYRGSPLDLVVADPPYDLPAMAKLPALVVPHVVPDGLFVLEHDVRHRFDDHPHLEDSRTYGRTIVSIFRSRKSTDSQADDT